MAVRTRIDCLFGIDEGMAHMKGVEPALNEAMQLIDQVCGMRDSLMAMKHNVGMLLANATSSRCRFLQVLELCTGSEKSRQALHDLLNAIEIAKETDGILDVHHAQGRMHIDKALREEIEQVNEKTSVVLLLLAAEAADEVRAWNLLSPVMCTPHGSALQAASVNTHTGMVASALQFAVGRSRSHALAEQVVANFAIATMLSKMGLTAYHYFRDLDGPEDAVSRMSGALHQYTEALRVLKESESELAEALQRREETTEVFEAELASLKERCGGELSVALNHYFEDNPSVKTAMDARDTARKVVIEREKILDAAQVHTRATRVNVRVLLVLAAYCVSFDPHVSTLVSRAVRLVDLFSLVSQERDMFQCSTALLLLATMCRTSSAVQVAVACSPPAPPTATELGSRQADQVPGAPSVEAGESMATLGSATVASSWSYIVSTVGNMPQSESAQRGLWLRYLVELLTMATPDERASEAWMGVVCSCLYWAIAHNLEAVEAFFQQGCFAPVAECIVSVYRQQQGLAAHEQMLRAATGTGSGSREAAAPAGAEGDGGSVVISAEAKQSRAAGEGERQEKKGSNISSSPADGSKEAEQPPSKRSTTGSREDEENIESSGLQMDRLLDEKGSSASSSTHSGSDKASEAHSEHKGEGGGGGTLGAQQNPAERKLRRLPFTLDGSPTSLIRSAWMGQSEGFVGSSLVYGLEWARRRPALYERGTWSGPLDVLPESAFRPAADPLQALRDAEREEEEARARRQQRGGGASPGGLGRGRALNDDDDDRRSLRRPAVRSRYAKALARKQQEKLHGVKAKSAEEAKAQDLNPDNARRRRKGQAHLRARRTWDLAGLHGWMTPEVNFGKRDPQFEVRGAGGDNSDDDGGPIMERRKDKVSGDSAGVGGTAGGGGGSGKSKGGSGGSNHRKDRRRSSAGVGAGMGTAQGEGEDAAEARTTEQLIKSATNILRDLAALEEFVSLKLEALVAEAVQGELCGQSPYRGVGPLDILCHAAGMDVRHGGRRTASALLGRECWESMFPEECVLVGVSSARDPGAPGAASASSGASVSSSGSSQTHAHAKGPPLPPHSLAARLLDVLVDCVNPWWDDEIDGAVLPLPDSADGVAWARTHNTMAGMLEQDEQGKKPTITVADTVVAATSCRLLGTLCAGPTHPAIYPGGAAPHYHSALSPEHPAFASFCDWAVKKGTIPRIAACMTLVCDPLRVPCGVEGRVHFAECLRLMATMCSNTPDNRKANKAVPEMLSCLRTPQRTADAALEEDRFPTTALEIVCNAAAAGAECFWMPKVDLIVTMDIAEHVERKQSDCYLGIGSLWDINQQGDPNDLAHCAQSDSDISSDADEVEYASGASVGSDSEGDERYPEFGREPPTPKMTSVGVGTEEATDGSDDDSASGGAGSRRRRARKQKQKPVRREKTITPGAGSALLHQRLRAEQRRRRLALKQRKLRRHIRRQAGDVEAHRETADKVTSTDSAPWNQEGSFDAAYLRSRPGEGGGDAAREGEAEGEGETKAINETDIETGGHSYHAAAGDTGPGAEVEVNDADALPTTPQADLEQNEPAGGQSNEETPREADPSPAPKMEGPMAPPQPVVGEEVMAPAPEPSKSIMSLPEGLTTAMPAVADSKGVLLRLRRPRDTSLLRVTAYGAAKKTLAATATEAGEMDTRNKHLDFLAKVAAAGGACEIPPDAYDEERSQHKEEEEEEEEASESSDNDEDSDGDDDGGDDNSVDGGNASAAEEGEEKNPNGELEDVDHTSRAEGKSVELAEGGDRATHKEAEANDGKVGEDDGVAAKSTPEKGAGTEQTAKPDSESKVDITTSTRDGGTESVAAESTASSEEATASQQKPRGSVFLTRRDMYSMQRRQVHESLLGEVPRAWARERLRETEAGCDWLRRSGLGPLLHEVELTRADRVRNWLEVVKHPALRAPRTPEEWAEEDEEDREERLAMEAEAEASVVQHMLEGDGKTLPIGLHFDRRLDVVARQGARGFARDAADALSALSPDLTRQMESRRVQDWRLAVAYSAGVPAGEHTGGPSRASTAAASSAVASGAASTASGGGDGKQAAERRQRTAREVALRHMCPGYTLDDIGFVVSYWGEADLLIRQAATMCLAKACERSESMMEDVLKTGIDLPAILCYNLSLQDAALTLATCQLLKALIHHTRTPMTSFEQPLHAARLNFTRFEGGLSLTCQALQSQLGHVVAMMQTHDWLQTHPCAGLPLSLRLMDQENSLNHISDTADGKQQQSQQSTSDASELKEVKEAKEGAADGKEEATEGKQEKEIAQEKEGSADTKLTSNDGAELTANDPPSVEVLNAVKSAVEELDLEDVDAMLTQNADIATTESAADNAGAEGEQKQQDAGEADAASEYDDDDSDADPRDMFQEQISVHEPSVELVTDSASVVSSKSVTDVLFAHMPTKQELWFGLGGGGGGDDVNGTGNESSQEISHAPSTVDSAGSSVLELDVETQSWVAGNILVTSMAAFSRTRSCGVDPWAESALCSRRRNALGAALFLIDTLTGFVHRDMAMQDIVATNAKMFRDVTHFMLIEQESVRCVSSSLIRACVQRHATNRRNATDSGIIPRLMLMATSDDVLSRAHAVSCIEQLVIRNSEMWLKVCEYGGVPALVNLSSLGNATIQVLATTSLCAFSRVDKRYVDIVVAAGQAKSCTRMLDSKDIRVVENALKLLAQLITSAVARSQLVDVGCMDKLLTLLTFPDEEVVAASLDVLREIVSYGTTDARDLVWTTKAHNWIDEFQRAQLAVEEGERQLEAKHEEGNGDDDEKEQEEEQEDSDGDDDVDVSEAADFFAQVVDAGPQDVTFGDSDDEATGNGNAADDMEDAPFFTATAKFYEGIAVAEDVNDVLRRYDSLQRTQHKQDLPLASALLDDRVASQLLHLAEQAGTGKPKPGLSVTASRLQLSATTIVAAVTDPADSDLPDGTPALRDSLTKSGLLRRHQFHDEVVQASRASTAEAKER